MKIGLLGGSFNPPHQGHIFVSKLALKKFALNQIWWIPTARNPLKSAKSYEKFQQRFEKSLEINKNNQKIRVKFFPEIYSFDLISKLQKQFPNHDFIWLMGSDNLKNFHRWKNFRKIIQMIKIVVFNRNDCLLRHQKTKSYKIYQNFCNHKKSLQKLPKIKIVRSRNYNISSTEIRNKNALSK